MTTQQKTFIDISKKEDYKDYGNLLNRFCIVEIIVEQGESLAKRLQLVNCKVELSFKGFMDGVLGGQPITGGITIYSSLNGYDQDTSLLYQIQQVTNKKVKTTISPVTINVIIGYMGMLRETDYVFSALVYKIHSSKDESKKTQAWKFDLIKGNLYNNDFASIYKREAIQFLTPASKYIDILNHIYTPLGSKKSLLEGLFSPIIIDDELLVELNKEIHANYNLNFSASERKRGGAFEKIVSDFWNFTKEKGGVLEGKEIVNLFTKKSAQQTGANKVRLSLQNVKDLKTYYLLDDSKIKSLPLTEDAYFAVECLFDPSVFVHDGIVVLTRYFTSLIVPSDLSLLTTGTSVIVDRNSDLNGADLTNLPVWYIISYDLNFNTTSSSPCMTTLYLARQLLPVKVT